MSSLDPFEDLKPKSVRKVKFKPKAPPKTKSNLVLPKPEKVEDADSMEQEKLQQLFQEISAKGKYKSEKQTHRTQVAFDPRGSSAMRPCSFRKSEDGRVMKEYKEPWDQYSYYPVTLPLRRPYSGNPELLDEAEFGDSSASVNYEDTPLNAAEELGLMEENLEARMLFLQLPKTMPLLKEQIVKTDDQATAGGSKPSNVQGSSTNKLCTLNELPPGYMGKMLVYKSGAVKMKLGDALFDVAPGLDCVFAQDAVAINIKDKQCCNLGEINTRATITPDIDYMLANMPEL